METPRHTTVRLVRNQSINLTTGVVTEGDVTVGYPTITEVINRNPGLRANDPVSLASMFRIMANRPLVIAAIERHHRRFN